MDLTVVVTAAVTAFLVTAVLTFSSIFKKPDWIESRGLSKIWPRKVLLFSTIPTLAVSIPVSILMGRENFNFTIALAVTSSITILSYIFFQSIYTDISFRLVDRRLFHIGLLISFLTNGLYLFDKASIEIDWKINTISALSLFILASFMLFFMGSIGASDARALQLVAISSIPLIGINGFVWGMVLLTGLLFLAAIILISLKKKIKISFPAVPIILLPYLLVTIYGTFAVIKQFNF